MIPTEKSPEEEFIIGQLRANLWRIEAGNLSPEIIDLIKASLELMVPMLEIMKRQLKTKNE